MHSTQGLLSAALLTDQFPVLQEPISTTISALEAFKWFRTFSKQRIIHFDVVLGNLNESMQDIYDP